MNEQTVITGMGAIASNGQTIHEFFEHCKQGKKGITDSIPPVFSTKKLRTKYWGAISLEEETEAAFRSCDALIYRSLSLAKHAAKEALEHAGLKKEDIERLGARAAMITGSLSYDDYHILEASRYLNHMTSKKERLSFLDHLSDFSTKLKAFCGIRGICLNLSSACASGTAAIGMGMELIRSGEFDLVLVCGADSLSQMVAYGFHSLKVLDSNLCRPLDQERNGINIGEGCGFLVLESLSHARKRNAPLLAECVGHSLGNEAFHITSPDPDGDGFFSSMKRAMEDAKLTPEEIDYINLHGTGSIANDHVELMAVLDLYKDCPSRPYVSSLKTLIGHCMGAAGALEAVLTVLCLKNQFYLPIFDVRHPTEELNGFSIEPPKEKTPMRYAMSNSFAFAGNTASVIFGPVEDRTLTAFGEQEIYLNGIGVLLPQAADTKELTDRIRTFLSEDKMAEPTNSTVLEQPLNVTGISAKKLRGITRLSRMVLSASLQAMGPSALDFASRDANRIGTFFSSGNGSLSSRLKFGESVAKETPELSNPTLFANISPNAPLGHLCINLNCKGPSASLHGALPLLPSMLSLKKDCDSVLSSMAEEAHELLKNQRESAITLLLQHQLTETSFCRITYFQSCDIHLYLTSSVNFKELPAAPELILTQDDESDFDLDDQKLLTKQFPNVPFLSTNALTGKLGNTTLYANLAIAGILLKEQLCEGTSILVTGYDVCENYYRILCENRTIKKEMESI